MLYLYSIDPVREIRSLHLTQWWISKTHSEVNYTLAWSSWLPNIVGSSEGLGAFPQGHFMAHWLGIQLATLQLQTWSPNQ